MYVTLSFQSVSARMPYPENYFPHIEKMSYRTDTICQFDSHYISMFSLILVLP